MKGFFITGTDTGVGKSIVSAALIGALRSMGHDACGMKPVESGCEGSAVDGQMLRDASGIDEPMGLITPFTFKAPLAPLSAARLEGRTVDKEMILGAARELASRHEALVVEGVGGFLVPLADDGYLVRDLALDLALPVIVVSTPFLGTVNHTLLTVEAVRGAGLEMAGVVFCQNTDTDDKITAESSRSLVEEFTGMPLLGALPYMKGVHIGDISEAGRSCLNLARLSRYL